MFVRAKTIKQKKYGYLVENVWKKNKVSQKVKKYLGPIIFVNTDLNFNLTSVENYDWNKPIKLLFRDIISDFFIQLGFERKNCKLIKDNLTINLATCKITLDEKDVVLELNQRYLYGKTLFYMQNFIKDEEEQVKGTKLAELFSNYGISIDKDVFVSLYKRIYLI